MKKYIIGGFFVLPIVHMYSADFSSLALEVKSMIRSELVRDNSNFKTAIGTIKKLFLVDKNWQSLLNSSQEVQLVLRELRDLFDIKQSIIAFALDIPSSREWLQKQYPLHPILNVFQEATLFVVENHDKNEKLLTDLGYYIKQMAKRLSNEERNIIKEVKLNQAKIDLREDDPDIAKKLNHMNESLRVAVSPYYMLRAIDSNQPIFIPEIGYFYNNGTFLPQLNFSPSSPRSKS